MISDMNESKRLQEMHALMMDINRVRERCNEILREMAIDQAMGYLAAEEGVYQ